MSQSEKNSSGMASVKAASNSAPLIVVRSCKYDGQVHREWRASLICLEKDLIVLDGVFETEVNHPQLGHIARGTHSREFFWLNRWYSIFRFHEPDGALRNFYCNINLPPAFDGKILRFVDLDIDLLVAPDLSFRVLDLEEFESNAARYNYTAEVRQAVTNALNELEALIKARQFPFDFLSSQNM